MSALTPLGRRNEMGTRIRAAAALPAEAVRATTSSLGKVSIPLTRAFEAAAPNVPEYGDDDA